MATSNSIPTSETSEKQPSSAVNTGKFLDPQTLIRIKSLQLRAKMVVEGFLSGLHRSPYHGFSVEFTEYREYTPGDDPRYLDWRLFARSDRYYVKRFEDETNLRCQLLIDVSSSMGYGEPYTKADYARTIAASLAYFLTTQRDAVGVMSFGEQIYEYLPARYRPGQLRRVLMCLEHPVDGQSTDLIRPLEQIAERVTKRGMLVLISDLLTPLTSLETQLSYLRARGHEVVLFQILDPTEINFDFDSPALFHDLESAKEVYIDPNVARSQYLKNFQAHQDGIQATCDKLGISFHQLSTDIPCETALVEFLHQRAITKAPLTRNPSRAGRRIA